MTKFHLKNPQKNIPAKEQQPSPIVMTYHFQGTRLRAGIGESILPKDWNPAKQRPRSTATGSDNLAKLLDRLELKVKDVHLDLKAEFADVTPGILRTALTKSTGTGRKRQSLTNYFEQYVAAKREKLKMDKSNMYQAALSLFKEMPGGKEFADITPDWFDRFCLWMESRVTKKTKNGASPNYIAVLSVIIKEVMTAAHRDGLHRNLKYKDYHPDKEQAETIYLTQDELSLLERVELPPNLDRDRDRLLLACYTGLRYSDVSKITKDNVRDGVLRDRNRKTGEDVSIPLHPVVVGILEKYPDGMPKAIQRAWFNENIKKICREAGITTPVVIHRTRGGKSLRETVEKCELVSSHTGRRSFATNAAISGMPLSVIRHFTGHTTEAALSRYIRLGYKEATASASAHPFFAGRSTDIGDKQ